MPTGKKQPASGVALRYSRQRERLLEVLRATTTHPTAGWLYDMLKPEFPNLSLGTVYRNLAVLIAEGLVKKIDSGSTFDRFEAKTTAHYHLICRKCGTIIDFEKRIFPEIEDVVNSETDFSVEGHRIDFFGTCSACRARNRNNS
ncbi:MAG: transcriptional repressor [Chlorobi bacterium]|nr:transcriptional repressor [Chlorobiota bacterium]